MTTTPPRVIDSPYLTTREAIVYLRLSSPSSLYHLITDQRLPHLRRGGRLLFDRRELDAWLRGTDAVTLARDRKRA
jgi:excisionase family DNA binding protein